VGVILRPEANRGYKVIGVADHERKPSVSEVKAGDTLLTVDNARVSGGTMGQVWSLLSGSPGEMRTLGLERDGKPLTVKATVYRFLPSVKEATKAKKH
jgi:C-terminal processing protease CtpA/Prc